MLADPLAVIGIFMFGAASGALCTYAKPKLILAQARELLQIAPAPQRQPSEWTERFALKALVISRDLEVTSVFSDLLGEKQISAQHCFPEDALEQLSSDKFAAMVVDLDQFPECIHVLKNLPGANKRILVIAIASDSVTREIASPLGASFIIQRPLHPLRVRNTLTSAYGRMLRDSQAYFRLAVELPVSIQRSSGGLLQCTTLNLSQSGMAVSTPATFIVGESIHLAFAIPNTDVFVTAEGKVIWDDKHGKAGINFECTSSSIHARFCEWLQDHFYMKRDDTAESGFPQQVAYAG